MEHPGPRLDEDGIAELFDGREQEQRVPRPLLMVLVAVVGTAVVLALIAVLLVQVLPPLAEFVRTLVELSRPAGA
ncbi:hypothetical protein [Pseudolysinimonas sp.]|uniref:hypothetical protein n=1 Tax=Pseudolysinimonas sp. TaxID=2680009 RepID=UPI003F7EC769